jgi:hypothetical protein
MTSITRPTPDDGGATTFRKHVIDPGTNVVRDTGSGDGAGNDRPRLKASGQAATGSDELDRQTSPGTPPTARTAARTGATRQALAGAARTIDKHMPPKPVPTPGAGPAMAPLPSLSPAGAVAPNPTMIVHQDQSLTPSQQQELRDTLRDHGLSADEANRVIEQMMDGVPAGGIAIPLPGGGAFPMPGGGGIPMPGGGGIGPVPPIQLQQTLQQLLELGLPAPGPGIAAAPAQPLPTHRAETSSTTR